jgi:predicted membrane protein
MINVLTWGFWWLNVVLSAGSVLYQARDRYPDGTPGLVMPSGQIWVWQLIFSFVVLGAGISPWNLLWLGIVSIILSILIARIYIHIQLIRRIQMQETYHSSNFENRKSGPYQR